MKNILIAALALISLSIPAKAQMTNAQAVKVVVPYKTTCSSQTISTSATEVSGNTTVITTTGGISRVKVTNLDSSASVCCSDSSSVATSGNSIGDCINGTTGQKNWLAWGISAIQPWYCIATTSNVSILVCKVR